MVDVVYALHTFEAENEDELTFEAGDGNHKQALALALPRPQRGAWRFCSPMAPVCLRLRVWTRMVQMDGSDRSESC